MFSWWDSLIHRTRTLRVDILTLFLSLFSISLLLIISFSYYNTLQSIYRFSTGSVLRVSASIVDKVNELARDANQLIEVSSALLLNKEDISPNNASLVSYMKNVVKYDSNVSNFYIGTEDGSFMGAANFILYSQKCYASDPTKPLPPGISYVFRYYDATDKNPQDRWYYLDDNFQTITSETFNDLAFDPRKRPWFKGAVRTRGLFWTGMYAFEITSEEGISVSYPVFDNEGKIFAVVGGDLTFLLLSSFLTRLEIGKSGKAFILNKNGEIVLPLAEEDVEDSNDALHRIAHMAYQEYLETSEQHFVLSDKRVRYLAYIQSLPVISGGKWIIAIVIPYNDFFSELLETQRHVLLITFGILLLTSLIVVYFSKRISRPIVILSREVDKIRQLDLDSETRVSSNIKEIILMDASIAAMRRAVRSFSRYVPKEVVKQLIEKGEEIALGGEKMEITIFFSDIASFSSIAETLTTEILTALLFEYYDGLSKIILEAQGTIDKYIGDSIMAFWGAPIKVQDHAVQACYTALRCRSFSTKLNQTRREEGNPEFFTRFGINTGSVIVGNIGTAERMNYTVMGDAVNIASRLQQVDKEYHTSIIISDEVHKRLQGEFLVRPLDIVSVKGKKEQIKIYELVAVMKGDPDITAQPGEIKLCTDFTKAYDSFFKGDVKDAKVQFESILQEFPEDFPTKKFLDRINKVLAL